MSKIMWLTSMFLKLILKIVLFHCRPFIETFFNLKAPICFEWHLWRLNKTEGGESPTAILFLQFIFACWKASHHCATGWNNIRFDIIMSKNLRKISPHKYCLQKMCIVIHFITFSKSYTVGQRYPGCQYPIVRSFRNGQLARRIKLNMSQAVNLQKLLMTGFSHPGSQIDCRLLINIQIFGFQQSSTSVLPQWRSAAVS